MPTDAAPHADPAPPPAAEELFCPHCGYNLRGIASRRCPECGRDVDRAGLAEVQVPWAQRKRIGRVRAYVRTVWMAVAYPRQLARQADRPLIYEDARWFWVVTILILSVSFTVYWFVSGYDESRLNQLPAEMTRLMWARSPQRQDMLLDLSLPLSAVYALPPTVPIVVMLFLFAATGSSSYWFHPRRLSIEQQNRAVAASYYTCGPLALHLLLVIPVIAIYALNLPPKVIGSELVLATALAILIFVSLVLPPLAWLYATVLMARHVRGYGVLEALGLYIVLPLQWALIALLCGCVLPWVAGLVVLMVASLD